MAQRQIGNEPLSEPVLTQFHDAYIQHQGEMSSTKEINYHDDIMPWKQFPH